MKLITFPLLFISLMFTACTTKTELTQAHHSSIFIFLGLSQNFEQMYAKEKISYSLAFKDLDQGLIAYCAYNTNKDMKTVYITLDTAKTAFMNEKIMNNFLIHEMEYCSQRLLKALGPQTQTQRLTSNFAQSLLER